LSLVSDGDITKENEIVKMPMMQVINNYMHKALSTYNIEVNRFANRPKNS
jgi:hypothetical protein